MIGNDCSRGYDCSPSMKPVGKKHFEVAGDNYFIQRLEYPMFLGPRPFRFSELAKILRISSMSRVISALPLGLSAIISWNCRGCIIN